MIERKSGIRAHVVAGVLLAIAFAAAVGYAKPTLKITQSEAAPEETVGVPWSVIYHDGSANGFRFWKDSLEKSARFEYFPVQPKGSSTGTYSGGRERKGKMGSRGASELWRWVRKLESDSSLRANARNKGTGAFMLRDPSGEKREFIIEDGPLLREFNQFLAQFR